MNKWEYKQTLLNKQTDLKGQHNFILFYFVICADPATFLASGDLVFLWEQRVYSVIETINVLSLYYYLINIVNIEILSLNFIYPNLQSAPLKSSSHSLQLSL